MKDRTTLGPVRFNYNFGRLRCFGLALLIVISAERAHSSSLEDLASTDSVVFQKAVAAESARFREQVQLLIKAVESAQDSRTKRAAITQLGTLRATDAVPCLLKHLTEVKVTFRSSTSKADPVFGDYACALALVEIGNTAVTPIVDAIAVRSNGSEIKILAHVLAHITGSSEAVLRLTQAAERASPEDRAEIDSAITSLKNLPPS